MRVRLPRSLLTAIRDAARRSTPDECCGLLTGIRSESAYDVGTVHPSNNVTTGDRTRTFEVDPKLRFDLMRACEAADNGHEIIGHYHSHPSGPAEPSATDLSMTYETQFVWLICGQDGDVKAFKPEDDRSAFQRLHLEITHV